MAIRGAAHCREPPEKGWGLPYPRRYAAAMGMVYVVQHGKKERVPGRLLREGVPSGAITTIDGTQVIAVAATDHLGGQMRP